MIRQTCTHQKTMEHYTENKVTINRTINRDMLAEIIQFECCIYSIYFALMFAVIGKLKTYCTYSFYLTNVADISCFFHLTHGWDKTIVPESVFQCFKQPEKSARRQQLEHPMSSFSCLPLPVVQNHLLCRRGVEDQVVDQPTSLWTFSLQAISSPSVWCRLQISKMVLSR